VVLSNVELVDDYLTVTGPTDDVGGDGVLSPGETWDYEVPMVEQPDSGNGEHMNTATVTARDAESSVVTDTDVAYWTGPPIEEEETPTEEMTPEENVTAEEEETPEEEITPGEEETPVEEITPEEETPVENMTT
jgi:hypothetical protein